MSTKTSPTLPTLSRRHFMRVAAGAITLVAVACSPVVPSDGSAAIAPAKAADAVKRGNLRSVTYPAAIAKARGYFAEVGIEDEEIVFADNAQQIQAIAVNDVDLATSSNASIFFNALRSGVDMRFTCDNWQLAARNNSYMMVVHPDRASEIQNFSDLRGRTIAMNTPVRDGGINFTTDKLLQTNGMTFEDMQWRQVLFPDMLGAFAKGDIDAAWMIEPFITLGKGQGLLTPWLCAGDYDPGSQIAGIVYSGQFSQSRSDVALRWMVANLRGVQDYNDYLNGKAHDVIAPILAAHTGLAREVVEQVAFPAIAADGKLNSDSILHSQEQLLAWGKIEEVLPLSEVIDHTFVEEAHQMLTA